MDTMVAITGTVVMAMVANMVQELKRMKKKIIGMMEVMIKKKKDIIHQEMKLKKIPRCLVNLSQNG